MDNQLFKMFSAAALAVGMLFPALASAQAERDRRIYLGAGIGQATIDDFCFPTGASLSADLDSGGTANDVVTVTGCEDRVVSFGGFAGYRLNDNFAAEAGFAFANEYAHKIGVQFNGAGSQQNDDVQFDVQTVFLGAVVHFPFTTTTETSVFVKAGMHFWEAEVSVPNPNFTNGEFKTDGNDPYFGFGVQHMLSDELGLQGEWVRYKVKTDFTIYGIKFSDTDVDVFGLNFIYLL